jgi:hypothetical protein
MRKKTCKPAMKQRCKSVKNPAEKSFEQDFEVQRQVRLGKEIIKEYREALSELAKS